MKFGGKHTVQSRMAAAENRLGKTTGASKGAAKASSKPKVTPSGTKPGKKQIGIKAKWTF
jgi:hypothetical protein